MRRVVAIAGGLCVVAAAFLLVRRETAPMSESGGADDSPWSAPDDARDGALQGALQGSGRAGTAPAVPSDGTGRNDADAGPGPESNGTAPRRPHVRRTILDEDGRPIAAARVEALAKPNADVFRDPELGERLGATATDEQGRFLFEFADERRPDVFRVTAPGRPTVLFRAGGTSGALRFVRTTLVRGRTVSIAPDALVPVAGALIEAHSVDAAGAPIRSSPFGVVRSALDGTFSLRLPGEGIASLTALGPTSRSESKEIRVGAGDVSDVVLFLAPSGEPGVAEGRVLLDGRPMAGVRIGLRPNASRNAAVASDVTGPDGRYRVGPVWDGVEKIVVDASAIGLGTVRVWAKFEVKDGRATEDVILPRAWSVSGRVTRGATPVVGARVAARPVLGDTEAGFAAATTDGSGTFRVVGCFDRRPTVSVSVTAPEGDSAVDGVPFDASLWDVTGEVIELAAFGRIRGRVLDAEARPIAGAHVHARSDVLSGADGRFDVLADPGRTRIEVSCDGYVGRTSAWTFVPYGDAGTDLDVVLRRGDAVSGRILDADRRGVVGAVVRVDGLGGIGGSSTVRVYAVDGRFLSQAVAGEILRVTVSADGFETRVIEGVGPDTELPDIVLERTAEAPAPR